MSSFGALLFFVNICVPLGYFRKRASSDWYHMQRAEPDPKGPRSAAVDGTLLLVSLYGGTDGGRSGSIKRAVSLSVEKTFKVCQHHRVSLG